MRICRLEIAGSPARSTVCLESLRPGLNVVTGSLISENSAIADCISHLLYGRTSLAPDRPAGSVEVDTELGKFRLRREPEKQRAWRLTISGLGAEPAAADTISRVLQGCSSQFLSGLYFLDGNHYPQTDWLLSESVANSVNRLYDLGKKGFLKQSENSTQLDEVRDEVARWQTTLHDVERREMQVQKDLAQLRPIERTVMLPLADQRAVLAVTERLVCDLQYEIASIARIATSNICVCRDIYPRLLSLVNLLEQQVTRLTSLNGEHERAIRWQELQSEAQHLARTQAELRDQLSHFQCRDEHTTFRSSDCLARMTNGRLVKIKLVSGGRRACVVDNRGQMISVESLSRTEQQLVAISLRLAIVAGLEETGLSLPLILHEPFAFLDDPQAAILAGVLLDFADTQVFLFTQRQAALEKFREGGATIHDIQRREHTVQPVPETRRTSRAKQIQHQEPGDRTNPPALRIKDVQSEKPKRRKSRAKTREQSRSKSVPSSKPKFHLELDSPIETMQSISPELVVVLKANGIRQVRELLAADASKLTTHQLAEIGIPEVEIVGWQHQARLCCRIPGLRPIDAAILVGAGFSFPEDIAAMNPAELQEFVQSFVQTRTGRELLENNSTPDLAQIESWIWAARQARVLGAA